MEGIPSWLRGYSLPAMWKTWVWSLGRKDPLEKKMATHSSILAWKIPWVEEPGGLQGYSPQGHRESDTTELLHFHFHHDMKQYGWLSIVLAPMTGPILGSVCPQLLPSLALFCITGKLTPPSCKSLVPMTASFSLRLAKRRDLQIFEGEQRKKSGYSFPSYFSCAVFCYLAWWLQHLLLKFTGFQIPESDSSSGSHVTSSSRIEPVA